MAVFPLVTVMLRPAVIDPAAFAALSVMTHCGLFRFVWTRARIALVVAVIVSAVGFAQAALGGAAAQWGMGLAAALLAQAVAPSGAGRVRTICAAAVLALPFAVLQEPVWIVPALAGGALLAATFATNPCRNRDVLAAAALGLGVVALAHWPDGALVAVIGLTALGFWVPRTLYLPLAGFAILGLVMPLADMMVQPAVLASFAGLFLVGARMLQPRQNVLETLFDDAAIAKVLGARLAILRLDTARRVAAPIGGGAFIPFDRLFNATDPQSVLDLLDPSRQAAWQAQGWRSVVLAQDGTTHRWQARLLRDRHGLLLAAIDAGAEDNLVSRAHAAEGALAQSRIREERLLSFASHELRTPVSVIDMLLEEMTLGRPWQDIQPQLETAVQGLKSVLDDLGVASGDTGDIAVRQSFTLRVMADALIARHAAAAEGSGLRLSCELGDDADHEVRGDYGRALLAVSRLVENAMRHSGGQKLVIRAFLTTAPSEAVWHIADDGAGIPVDRREAIFDPFTQSGGESGMGLYTARQLARLAGGDLTIEPSTQGACFALRHPVRRA